MVHLAALDESGALTARVWSPDGDATVGLDQKFAEMARDHVRRRVNAVALIATGGLFPVLLGFFDNGNPFDDRPSWFTAALVLLGLVLLPCIAGVVWWYVSALQSEAEWWEEASGGSIPPGGSWSRERTRKFVEDALPAWEWYRFVFLMTACVEVTMAVLLTLAHLQ